MLWGKIAEDIKRIEDGYQNILSRAGARKLGGFNREYDLFPELIELMGVRYASRASIMSYISSYIKLNKLQIPHQMKEFKIDANLSKLFGKDVKTAIFMDITKAAIKKTKTKETTNTSIEDEKLEKINLFKYEMKKHYPNDDNQLRIMQIKWISLGFIRLSNIWLKWNPKDFKFYSAQKQSEIQTWLLSAKLFKIPKDLLQMMLEFIINAY